MYFADIENKKLHGPNINGQCEGVNLKEISFSAASLLRWEKLFQPCRICLEPEKAKEQDRIREIIKLIQDE